MSAANPTVFEHESRSWDMNGGVGRQAEGKEVSREDAKARKVGDRPSAAVMKNVLWQ
jgi:hypothetical protein